MTETNLNWLSEISSWRLEASEEDTSRYFYIRDEISSLQSGQVSYVIGRKGTGKTAVAEHIRGMNNHNVFVVSLSFASFPFNELYRLSDDGFTSPSQYTTIWKYLIYSAICSKMSTNQRIDPAISSSLGKHFALDFDKALASSISRLTDISTGFKIVGTGLDVGKKTSIVQNDTPWPERVEILEKIINEFLDSSTYYVIFDELDEDYNFILETRRSNEYFDLLTGLFKAVADVKRRTHKRLNIRPIVFLRDDIYELLRANDKNKWNDSSWKLEWRDGELRELVTFRLEKARDPDSSDFSFAKIIKDLFINEERYTKHTYTRKQHVFEYITARTLRRPRDFISWLREAAKLTVEFGTDKLASGNFGKITWRYSHRLREEFVDEIQGSVPYIDDVFSVFSHLRTNIFKFEDMRSKYESFVKSRREADLLPFDTLAHLLFHYGAIGNLPRENWEIFRYRTSHARLNLAELGIVHPGLVASLQLGKLSSERIRRLLASRR